MPGTIPGIVSSTVPFFLCTIQLVGIRHPLVVVAGGKAVSLKGDFAFWYLDR